MKFTIIDMQSCSIVPAPLCLFQLLLPRCISAG